MKKWVIEFRSGTYFQNLEADNGGLMRTAQQFDSKKKAEEFMDKSNWIYFNGGMAVPFKNG